MRAPIELLVYAIHRTHSVVLRRIGCSWLLLTLYSVSSIWSNMTTASRSIHNLHWPISEARKHRFRINICLCLSFLHLMTGHRSSMRHIAETVGVPYHHAVVVAQHVTVIYVRLVVLVVLRVSEHLSWSILHSLRRNSSF